MPYHYTCQYCGKAGATRERGQRYCSNSCSANGRPRLSNSERFWEKVDRSGGDDACWPWQASKIRNGYGAFAWVDPDSGERHKMAASRAAFWLTHGYWPTFACHHCDSPSCCNPRHIYDGTPLQNMRDRTERGRARQLRGEEAPWSILTEAEVLAIRVAYAQGNTTYKRLASEFGASEGAIGNIVRGANWKAGPWP